MRIKCKGYWTPSTPNGPAEFDCEYEKSAGFGCEDCIINGGSMSPVSGKPFRGNPAPYDDEVLKRYGAQQSNIDIPILEGGNANED